ncbi:MAG: nucleoside deaminase [Mariprofundaceae bacterium]
MNCGMTLPDIQIQMPDWLNSFIIEQQYDFQTVTSRMGFVIELARLNVEQQTGGPFGAAIFNMQTHELVAAGVNLVVTSNCSMAHAEMIAISHAQKKLNHFDLGAANLPRLELVTSSEPCAMCFGALPWSGIRHLSCGARDEDARAIGFDEGPKHPDWIHELNNRGITVATDICRDEAAEVFQNYVQNKGLIYNARQG